MRAIKKGLGWSISVALCILYGLLLPIFLLFFFDPLLFLVSAIALVILFAGCIALLRRVCRKLGWDSSGYCRGAIGALLLVPVFWFMIDAPPIAEDYGLQDVLSTDPQLLASSDTLMLLCLGGRIGAEMSGLPRTFFDPEVDILAQSESIHLAWDAMAEARAVIEKLDTFPGILDLWPHEGVGRDAPLVSFMLLRRIGSSYVSFAKLKAAEGNPAEGLEQLAVFHSVTIKAMPHATSFFSKVIWMNMAKTNIETALAIVRDTSCTPASLNMLKQSFPVLSEEDISFRRALIGEYVRLRTLCEDELKSGDFIATFSVSESLDAFDLYDWLSAFAKWGSLPGEDRIRKTVSTLVYHLSFRRNRTLRDLRFHYDLLIADMEKRPLDLSRSEASFTEYLLRQPDRRNPVGWMVVSAAMLSPSRSGAMAIQTKALSQLLADEIIQSLDDAPPL